MRDARASGHVTITHLLLKVAFLGGDDADRRRDRRLGRRRRLDVGDHRRRPVARLDEEDGHVEQVGAGPAHDGSYDAGRAGS